MSKVGDELLAAERRIAELEEHVWQAKDSERRARNALELTRARIAELEDQAVMASEALDMHQATQCTLVERSILDTLASATKEELEDVCWGAVGEACEEELSRRAK